MEGDNRPSLKLADLPALRDIYRVNATLADEELSITTRRYEQTVDRRDKLRERTRFGLLALNAASLAALLSSLGSQWIIKLQITDADIAQTVFCFLAGLMAGATAIWWSGITATRDAASDFENLLEVRQRKADYDGAATAEAEMKLVSRPTPKWKIPPDYRWSKIDNMLTNLAGAAWLSAIGGIAWKVAQHVEWCSPWCS
ncbi:hypothetical protein [Sphingobium herbicidovorans]|uniref:hypothetical protein n=1 Tax=Sphingobium herbicidovorans TaxID=76947 RepID=UPI0012E02B6D|nr:hypothetical protein [Sphingobium herbicidovorans]